MKRLGLIAGQLGRNNSLSIIFTMLGFFLGLAASGQPVRRMPPTRPIQATPGNVVIYEQATFSGRSEVLPPGDHAVTAWKPSSIRVPAGFVAILYEHAGDRGGSGVSVDLLEDHSDLSAFGLNGKVSFISIFPATRPGLIWVRNTMLNGEFVSGHWERPRAAGNPANTVAVASPSLPGAGSSQPTVVQPQGTDVPIAPSPGGDLPTSSPSPSACSAQKQALDALVARRNEINDELHQLGLPASEKSSLQQLLKQIGAQIFDAQRQLQICLHPGPLVPSGAVAPKEILSIVFNNPTFDETRYKYDWGREVATGTQHDSGTFPFSADKEWVQVLDPADEYDRSVVGATGWAVHPRLAGSDFPFSHPFGYRNYDWETSMVLDRPAQGAGPYLFLLASGNTPKFDNKEAWADAQLAGALGLPVTPGLFTIEMDSGLVPSDFMSGVKDGSRIAVFGRWIADAGHDDFHAEIHPPLVIAAANTIAPNATRVIFTSRPYLVGQTYTTDKDHIYNDGVNDDGSFGTHIAREIGKVVHATGPYGIPLPWPDSSFVEAHVKIKSHPFVGVNLLHFVVRPPAAAGRVGVAGGAIAAQKDLAVSFHFTMRSGCAVQITSMGDGAVDVLIALNEAGYHPPPLPARGEHAYSKDELNALHEGVASDIDWAYALGPLVALVSGGGPVSAATIDPILSRGIKGDVYPSLSDVVSVLKRTGAVENVSVMGIRPNAGMTVDNNQPFPVYGWLEVRTVEPVVAPTR